MRQSGCTCASETLICASKLLVGESVAGAVALPQIRLYGPTNQIAMRNIQHARRSNGGKNEQCWHRSPATMKPGCYATPLWGLWMALLAARVACRSQSRVAQTDDSSATVMDKNGFYVHETAKLNAFVDKNGLFVHGRKNFANNTSACADEAACGRATAPARARH